MVKGGKELIIGSKLEPGFGPVIMLGMGGIYVEVLKDVTFKLAPVTDKEADDMIASIKTQKITCRELEEKNHLILQNSLNAFKDCLS